MGSFEHPQHRSPEDDRSLSASDHRRRATYRRRFVPAIILYAVSIAALAALTDDSTAFLWLWYLFPVIPMAWIGTALLRDVRAADEYQQRLNLIAMSVGFAAAMASAVIIGLLGAAGVTTNLAGWICFGSGATGWAVTSTILNPDLRDA